MCGGQRGQMPDHALDRQGPCRGHSAQRCRRPRPPPPARIVRRGRARPRPRPSPGASLRGVMVLCVRIMMFFTLFDGFLGNARGARVAPAARVLTRYRYPLAVRLRSSAARVARALLYITCRRRAVGPRPAGTVSSAHSRPGAPPPLVARHPLTLCRRQHVCRAARIRRAKQQHSPR